jgi:group II intron reverse transcriptase/maturase
MIDYYETKQHPITKKMVLDAYKKVKENKGSAGVDGQSLEDFAEERSANLYKIWNRMTSGSYYPPVVKEVRIPKKTGGTRGLGIPTVSDRIAQQVVKNYLEPKVDESFHPDSYGYRPKKSAHQALEQTRQRCNYYSWVVDIDIRGFFDNIDHELMMRAVAQYTNEKWVLMYVERWLKAGVNKEGIISNRDKGTPQGGVISPLLANIFLHFTFDMWMRKHHPYMPFERYCDDAIIHCTTKMQAEFIKFAISKRMNECKLELNKDKTYIVYCKNSVHNEKQDQVSFDFLGYTFKPRYFLTKKGRCLLFNPGISITSMNEVRRKVRKIITRRFKGTIQELAKILNPKIAGWYRYYCEFTRSSSRGLWYWINQKMIKWIMKERKFSKGKAYRLLQNIYKSSPGLFAHWKFVRPL